MHTQKITCKTPKYAFVSRSLDSNGANSEADSHVGLVRDLPLHGGHIPEWHSALGSYAATSHPKEIPSKWALRHQSKSPNVQLKTWSNLPGFAAFNFWLSYSVELLRHVKSWHMKSFNQVLAGAELGGKGAEDFESSLIIIIVINIKRKGLS